LWLAAYRVIALIAYSKLKMLHEFQKNIFIIHLGIVHEEIIEIQHECLVCEEKILALIFGMQNNWDVSYANNHPKI